LTQEKKRIISPQRNLGGERYNHQCRRWSPENALRVREPVKLIADSLLLLLRALFSFRKFYKIFQDFLSHQIFVHMYKALNIDKKNKINYTV
jgi:hypothetical protein